MSEWVNGKFMLASPEINAAPATKFNPPQGAVRLICEVVLVLTGALTLLYIGSTYLNGRGEWLLGPVILVTSALAPTRLRKIKVTEIGLNFKQISLALRLLLIAILISFPFMVIGLLIVRHYNIAAPLAPHILSGLWLNWIFYQVMYIAVAEEIFFRGYLQTTIHQIIVSTNLKYLRDKAYLAIVFSAAIFALAHVILTDNVLSIVTFFPGIILGWLFFRTKSIIASIVFHALANIIYAGAIHWLV